MVRQSLATAGISPKRAFAAWHKLRAGHGIAAGEEGNIVTLAD
jgi:hypothetical protein